MRIPNPEKLSLVRLTLDNFMEHIDNIMLWVNDPAVTFYFAGMQKEKTREEEIEFYRNLLESKTDVVYSIINSDAEYVGQVSINKIDWIGQTGRVFLVITPKMQGRGYFYGAVKAIEDAGFTDVKLNKLWIIIRYENEMELKYRKCGFEPEGVLKEEYKIGDKRYDMIRMAILKKDYENWWETEGDNHGH